jgi:hypothetical protein
MSQGKYKNNVKAAFEHKCGFIVNDSTENIKYAAMILF